MPNMMKAEVLNSSFRIPHSSFPLVVSLRRGDGLFEVALAEREQRAARELPEVEPEPDAAETYRHGEHRQEAAREVARVPVRVAALVHRGGEEEDQIDHAHENHQQRDA